VDIPGVDGETWIHLFKDVCSTYWHAFVDNTKANFAEALEMVIKFYISQGHSPEVFRSDNENLLKDPKVMAILAKYGMTKQSSAPYQHYQNTVERDVQTLVKLIACILHSQGFLKARWWAHALFHAVEMHNRIPNRVTDTETPRSMVFKSEALKRTNVANTFNFKFGELVGVGIAKEHRKWKFDTKRELGVYVGQPEGQVDSHWIYFPFTDSVLARADVIPLEIPPADLAAFYLARTNMKHGNSSYTEVSSLARALGIASDDKPRAGLRVLPPPPAYNPFLPPRMGTRKRPAMVENPGTASSSSASGPQVDHYRTSIEIDCPELFFEPEVLDADLEKSGSREPPSVSARLFPETNRTVDPDLLLELCAREVGLGPSFASKPSSGAASSSLSATATSTSSVYPLNDEGPPTRPPSDKDSYPEQFETCGAKRVHNDENPTTTQALKPDNPNIQYWIIAIIAEVFKNLLKPGDPSIVPVDYKDIPRNAMITFLQFVHKQKIKQGRADRFKSRGCYMGNRLPKGQTETYSPTVSTLACAALQQVAIIDEMEQALVDTVGAFLAQDYPDTAPALYVKLPYAVAIACGLDPQQVYRVVKYLYGIPDASRAYYVAYRDLLLKRGYKQSAFDPCLFFKHADTGVTYAWIHVDDTWVAATTPALLAQFVKDVEVGFEVTVEPVDNYLGVHFTHLPDGSWLKTQPKLLDDLFKQHNIAEKPWVKTPAFTPSDLPRDDRPVNTTLYLSLVGALLFLLFSRPDIGFAVSWAASKAGAPTQADWRDLQRVLQYLYETRHKGLIIKKQPKGCPLQMTIHVDASYLLYKDSKAQTGFCLSLNDMGPFFCKSQKQAVVTTSSSHSEMRAFFVAVCEYVFLEQLFKEIGRPLTPPAVVYEDNQPVVTLLTREKSLPKQSKHFIMLVNYVRELIGNGSVEVRKIATNANFADIFTKHVQGRDFAYKCQQVLGRQPGEPVLEPVVPAAKKPRTESTDE
jgi:hypothetical protein